MGDVLRALENMVRKNPMEANTIIAEVRGQYITVAQAIEILKNPSHPYYQELYHFLSSAGFDPDVQINDYQWKLAYLRWLQVPEGTVLCIAGKELRKEDILREIENRTELGKKLALIQLNYLEEMAKD